MAKQPNFGEIQLNGIQLGMGGPNAKWHIDRHRDKLAKRALDCGIDIYGIGYDPKEIVDYGSSIIILVHTGLHLTPFPNSFAWLTDRSSSPIVLHGARVIDGKIDAGYTGELLVRIECHTIGKDEVCDHLQRALEDRVAIAQVVLLPYFVPLFVMESGLVISALSDRGAQGFGSTNLGRG